MFSSKGRRTGGRGLFTGKRVGSGADGRSSKSMKPQHYLNPSSSYKGFYSKANNDGNLFSYRRANRRPGGYHSPCFITEAATRGAGLADDCYELSVLRMFRREYVGALEDGEAVLREYHDKAPQIVQAIDELSGEDCTRKVWECLYVTGIVPSVLLVTSGQWDEAYRLYREMCDELEALFLEGHLDGYEPERWLDAWIEAKLADTSIEALDAAARGGVIPLEDVSSRQLTQERSHA